MVAPFTGVWIETDSGYSTLVYDRSRPSRACGLKPFGRQDDTGAVVAPFTGVWIETSSATAAAASYGRALHGRVD